LGPIAPSEDAPTGARFVEASATAVGASAVKTSKVTVAATLRLK